MKLTLAIVGLIAFAGCASKAPSAAVERQRLDSAYSERVGGALALVPPVALDRPTLFLWRDQRQAAAFAGFEQTTLTYSYVRWDDRQTQDGRDDRFTRRAISESFGVSWR